MSAQLPPKIWEEVKGHYFAGFKCTWQGLHALALKQNTKVGRVAISICTEKTAVQRRAGMIAREASPMLVHNVSFADMDRAIDAANKMLDVLVPDTFDGCPTCGREKL